ncbi:MAG: hypothetical protein WC470_01695 [Candidatus Paceibacterota bacterium]
MEETDKIKSALQNAKNIALFVNNNPDSDAIGSVLAVFFSLKKIGKKPFLVNPAPLKSINALIQRLTEEKLVLSFAGDVSEIFYEKNEKQTNIYLTPKTENVAPENFFCKAVSSKEDLLTTGDLPFDLLITLGANDYAKIEENFTGNPDALYQCDIINIDNNLSNQNYGDINVIKDNPCLSQTVACLINDLGVEYMNKKTASSLIFGLVNSPKNTRNKNNMKTLLWLLKNRGDFSLLPDYQKSGTGTKIKLLEAALKNLDAGALKNFEVYISSLSKNDFLTARGNIKDLAFVADRAKNFFQLPSFFLLWEQNNDINGLFFSNNTALINKIKTHFTGQYKESGGLLTVPADGLEKAKTAIIAVLP